MSTFKISGVFLLFAIKSKIHGVRAVSFWVISFLLLLAIPSLQVIFLAYANKIKLSAQYRYLQRLILFQTISPFSTYLNNHFKP